PELLPCGGDKVSRIGPAGWVRQALRTPRGRPPLLCAGWADEHGATLDGTAITCIMSSLTHLPGRGYSALSCHPGSHANAAAASGRIQLNLRYLFRAVFRLAATAALMGVAACTPTTETAAQAGKDPARPNILLIISDDIGVDVTSDMTPGLIDGLLRQYGPSGHNHPRYRTTQGRPASTPSLNALAGSGMRFTSAWAQPFCANTRASILSGLYPVRTGVLDYTGHLAQHHHSFVRDLKEKGGYSTAAFGKWHIAGLVQAGAASTGAQYPGMKPKEAGFDVFRGNLNGAPPTYWEYDYHVQDDSTPADQWRTEKAPTRSLPGIPPTTYTAVAKVA